MFTPFEAESRAASSRVLLLLGAACVLSGHVTCEKAPVPTPIRAPALASYVQPAGLRPVAVPALGQPVDAPSVMMPPSNAGAKMPMPDAPAAPEAAPYVINPAPYRTAPQALPGQLFMERTAQATPQAFEPSETDAFMGPLKFFLGLAAGAAVGATVTKNLMNSIMRKSVDSSLELGTHRRRARYLTMSEAAKPRPVQIIPSVLPADWANMGAECKKLEDAGVDRIQFDVMDGNFVPNLTFGPELIAACRKYTKVPFETQLMVSQYNCETMLDDYTAATKGPNGEPGVVIAHVEGNVHLHRTLSKIREGGGSPSVALNPHTPAEMIENVLDKVDHVLVMTVNPGFGGQAYIPTMVDKIRKIRGWIVERGLDVDIEVDGGVKADWTIAACAEAGANCFIAGSGMFAYDDLSEGCSELRKIAEAAQKGQVLKEGQTIKDLK